MSEIFVEKLLGFLVEGINKLGVGSFTSEITDYVEENGCNA
jgi:hypothetical protein